MGTPQTGGIVRNASDVGFFPQQYCNILRVHTALGRYPWAKLWYYCRSLDDQGSGKITINVNAICYELGVSRSCIYNWIATGKKNGAFRATYRWGSMWTLYLGSLHSVCKTIGLPEWGTTFLIDLDQLHLIRELTTAAITFNLQEQSRGEAIRNLLPQERKAYRVPEANEVIETIGKLQLTSQKTPTTGATIPFLLWNSASKVFVSKSFVPFGGSQRTIAARLSISDRTVRRHHATLKLEKRQLCQTKAEYKPIHNEVNQFGNAYIKERNGLSMRSTHETEMTEGKTFKMGNRVWINRCNIYGGSVEFASMKASKRAYWLSFGIDYDAEIRALRSEWHHMGMPSREFWRSEFLANHKACLWEHIKTINSAPGDEERAFSGDFPNAQIGA